jgi:hypothetical protein
MATDPALLFQDSPEDDEGEEPYCHVLFTLPPLSKDLRSNLIAKMEGSQTEQFKICEKYAHMFRSTLLCTNEEWNASVEVKNSLNELHMRL